MNLSEIIEEITKELEELEKRQDFALQKTRLVVRDCARAIKLLHTNNFKQAKELAKKLDAQVKELRENDKGFENIVFTAYQEYAEVKTLLALLEKTSVPDYKQLGIPWLPYLSGLADCVGELRRALQLALREGKREEAEYYFKKMNELYDELMVLKFSSSLVGALRRKQDVLRSQVEQARSEMLRH